MRNILKATGSLAVLACVTLTGCGAGDDNSGSQGKFGSTDDVAGTVAGLSLLDLGLFLAFDGAEPQSGTLAKAAQRKQGHAAWTTARAKPKATTTQNCDAGGTVSFTDDASTAFLEDGSSVASNCRSSSSDGNGTASSTINGRYNDKCTDSGQTTDNCRAFTIRIADGASGSSTLDFGFVSTNSSERADFTLKARADMTTSEGSDSESTTISGTFGFEDRVENFRGSATFSDFRSVYTFGSNGRDTETLNGTFGLTSNESDCNVGQVTVRTVSPLTYDSSGSTVAGELTLTDASGQTARVNANSDGSTTITLANGQTRTYSEEELFDTCL